MQSDKGIFSVMAKTSRTYVQRKDGYIMVSGICEKHRPPLLLRSRHVDTITNNNNNNHKND